MSLPSSVAWTPASTTTTAPTRPSTTWCSRTRRWSPAPAGVGARRAEAALGADPAFCASASREGDGRLLLRLRGKVSSGVDGRDGGRAESRAPEVYFALVAVISGRHGSSRGRRRAVQRVREDISAARVSTRNTTRRSHATVRLSSTCGLSQLASAGAAIVSNPHDGLEIWFEPGQEVVIVADADEAAYRALLDDPAQALAMGARARERVLDEHTYARRAHRVLDLLGLSATVVTP